MYGNAKKLGSNLLGGQFRPEATQSAEPTVCETILDTSQSQQKTPLFFDVNLHFMTYFPLLGGCFPNLTFSSVRYALGIKIYVYSKSIIFFSAPSVEN